MLITGGCDCDDVIAKDLISPQNHLVCKIFTWQRQWKPSGDGIKYSLEFLIGILSLANHQPAKSSALIKIALAVILYQRKIILKLNVISYLNLIANVRFIYPRKSHGILTKLDATISHIIPLQSISLLEFLAFC